MTDSSEWQDRVKGLLKAELAKRNINYQHLSTLLEESYGIKESPPNSSNKIAGGKFSTVFLVQVCEVIGCDHLRLAES